MIPLFLSLLFVNNRRITADNPRNFENNQSDYEPVLFVNKIIKDLKMSIIGTYFFKKILNSNNKFRKSFNSKFFKKDRFIDNNKPSNWVNIINKAFYELNADQINQLKYSSFEKLLDWIKASEISNAFDSIFDLRNDRE